MIDVHSHFFPATILDEVEAHPKALGVSYLPGERVLEFPSGRSRSIPGALTDLGARRDVLAELGIRRQVLSPWLDVTGDDMSGGQAAAWARLYNDGTAEEVGGDSAFPAFATLPVGNPPAAAEELRRAVEDLGFVGGVLPTQVGGLNLADAGLEVLLEAAEDLDVPLFLHPHRVLGAARMNRDFLDNLCGNPFEVTLAAVTLFFAGVPERYPRLRILLAHCGGALPLVAGRVAHGSCHAPGVSRRIETPDELLDCYFYDTLVHDVEALAFCLAKLSSARCVAGSDIPFPMALEDPRSHVREALAIAGRGDDFERVTEGAAVDLVGRRLVAADELH